MNQESFSTPLQDYITEVLPWAHGHQIKAIMAYMAAIIDKQTGVQATLARSFGNQEAACKRISRLLHNKRLKPSELAEAVIHQALSQVPHNRRVRFTIDWTSEADQHLLSISLVVGRRCSSANTLIMRKSLIYNLLLDKDPSVQVVILNA